MDLQKQEDRYYRSQSELMLRYTLMEIETVEKYDSGEIHIPEEKRSLFEAIVDKIVSEYRSQNDINDEFIGQRFEIEDYVEQRKMRCLLYYEAGKMLSQRKDLQLSDLAKLYDNVYSSLFWGLCLSTDVVSNLIADLEDNFETEVLLKSRSFHSSGEALIGEIRKIYDDKAEVDDIVKHIDSYNDGSYTELPLSVYAISYICQIRGYQVLWMRLFETLRYFPLQGAMLYQLDTFEGYMSLLKYYHDKSDSKVAYRLALDKFLRFLNEVPEHLCRNSKSSNLSENQRKHCADLLKTWEEEYLEKVTTTTELLLDKLETAVVVAWYSKEKKRVDDMVPKGAEYYKRALNTMGSVIDKYVSLKEQELSDCSFDTLLYYASKADTTNTDYVKKLCEEICQRAYSEKFISSIRLTDSCFEQMRSICKLLTVSDIDGIVLMSKYRSSTEGYNVDSNALTTTCNGDNFWLPILVLQNENGTTNERLNTVIKILFTKVNSGYSASSDYLFTAFYLVELIVSQVVKDMKDNFEQELIESASNLIFVMRVLSANEAQMGEQVKSLLKARIDAEWSLERKLYRARDKELINFLDKYIEKF